MRRENLLLALAFALGAAAVALVSLTLAGVIHSSAHAERQSSSALAQATVAEDIVRSIQTERRQIAREGCRAQNQRHRNTIAALEKIAREDMARAKPTEQAELEQSRATIVLLIDALAPVEDCAAKVAKTTR